MPNQPEVYVPEDDDFLLETLMDKHQQDWKKMLDDLLNGCKDAPYTSRMPTLDTVAAQCLKEGLIDQRTFDKIHFYVDQIMKTL